MKWISFMLGLCVSIYGSAQQTLSADAFLNMVKQHHPLVRQASLDVEIGQARILSAKAVFDPAFDINGNAKTFESTRYYTRQVGELKFPLWYGIDLYTGSVLNRGERLTPESSKGTSYYTGISVPLLRNFLVDERRAGVRSARINKDQAVVKKTMAVNEVVAEAMLAYWKWWEQYNMVEEVERSVANASKRLHMVRTLFEQGERPAIDTLEAFSQVQALQQRRTEALSDLQLSRYRLALFAWKDSSDPSFANDLVPQAEDITDPGFQEMKVQAFRHPSILLTGLEIKRLKIERRIRLQQLLPAVNLTYESLSRDLLKVSSNIAKENNFYYGLALSVPLRLSEARGALRETRLNLLKADLANHLNQATVNNTVLQHYTQWQFLARQVKQQDALVATYAALQRGEEVKFAGGESSLFLINEREARTLEARQKLIKLKCALMQAAVKLRLASAAFAD